MIDWQNYGPIYTVSPGIKKIGDLPVIEFDQEESFDEYLESAYDQECSVAWLKVNTLRILKELCECDYRIALNDWISSEEEDGEIVSFDNGSRYHKVSDINNYIDENLE